MSPTDQSREVQPDDVRVTLIVSKQNLDHLVDQGVHGVMTLHLDSLGDDTYGLRTYGVSEGIGSTPNPVGAESDVSTVPREIFRAALLDSDGTLDDQLDKLTAYLENYLDRDEEEENEQSESE